MRQSTILPNKIIVKEIEEKEEVTATGIIKPNQVRKNPTRKGVVQLVGTECTTIKEGMTVLYTPLSATRFVVEEEELALLAESAVLFAYWQDTQV